MLDSNIVPSSILDPPVRTLLLQRTQVKVERDVKGEDEAKSALGKITKTDQGTEQPYRWRRGSIYSRNHPSRCSSSWGRTWLEERRQQDQVAIPVIASDAAIFGAQVAGDACIFARVDVDAGISWTHAGKSRRGHLLDAWKEADARIFLDARQRK